MGRSGRRYLANGLLQQNVYQSWTGQRVSAFVLVPTPSFSTHLTSFDLSNSRSKKWRGYGRRPEPCLARTIKYIREMLPKSFYCLDVWFCNKCLKFWVNCHQRKSSNIIRVNLQLSAKFLPKERKKTPRKNHIKSLTSGLDVSSAEQIGSFLALIEVLKTTYMYLLLFEYWTCGSV